jgi:hypothetical protein
MSWLLFLDESGHDHKNTPYEVRGGIALHASKLWSFISAVRDLEYSVFGTFLNEHESEIKGSKLLHHYRFQWAKSATPFDESSRRKHALNFLNNSRQRRTPRKDKFIAYGQASLAMVEGTLLLLVQYAAQLFASIMPHAPKPAGAPEEFLRKDQVFLLERFFYFLENKREMGLLVMDGTDKNLDRQFVRRMERYFTQTFTGRQRTQWIVPAPLFVESDMAYGVQVADLCIYCLNWGFRLREMTEPVRPEIEPFVKILSRDICWHGEGYRDGAVFKTHGIVYVPDPYDSR